MRTRQIGKRVQSAAGALFALQVAAGALGQLGMVGRVEAAEPLAAERSIGEGAAITTDGTPSGTEFGEDALFLGQAIATTLYAGSNVQVSISMRNTGPSTWTSGALFGLGARTPTDNEIWGRNRVALPHDVPPTTDVTFDFVVRAPAAPGSYTFQWQMVQDLVSWFGDFTPGLTVEVVSASDVRLVSHNAAAVLAVGDVASVGSAPPTVSADGRFVAFRSAAANLVPGGTSNLGADIFLRDVESDRIWLVSHAAGAASQGGNGPSEIANGSSSFGAVSADGRFVVFASQATDLVAGGSDSNGSGDVFQWNRETGEVRLVSHGAGSPATTGNGMSQPTGMSADGRFVIFSSNATDLVSGLVDTNLSADAYLWSRDSDAVTLISRSAASATTTANDYSFPRTISADGNSVALESYATNLVSGVSDAGEFQDLYRWLRPIGGLTLISHVAGSPLVAVDAESAAVEWSADGSTLLYDSGGVNLVPGQIDPGGEEGDSDLFLWSSASGASQLVSHVPGAPATTGNDVATGDDLSPDGRFVGFTSWATDVVVGITDLNLAPDVFVWDRTSDSSRLVSRSAASPTATADDLSGSVRISNQGDRAVFHSFATDLSAEGTELIYPLNVFFWEREGSSVQLLSSSADVPGDSGNGNSNFGRISSNGSRVVFASYASDLVSGGSDPTFSIDYFEWWAVLFADGFETGTPLGWSEAHP